MRTRPLVLSCFISCGLSLIAGGDPASAAASPRPSSAVSKASQVVLVHRRWYRDVPAYGYYAPPVTYYRPPVVYYNPPPVVYYPAPVVRYYAPPAAYYPYVGDDYYYRPRYRGPYPVGW